MDEFLDQPLRQVNPVFDKTILLFQTILESEARRLSPTFQLGFSWTLEKSDWQNNHLARAYGGLSNSLSTTYTS